MSMKNSHETIGNRTCDLPTCSAVFQLSYRVPSKTSKGFVISGWPTGLSVSLVITNNHVKIPSVLIAHIWLSCESWPPKLDHTKPQLIFRGIFGPTKENQTWRITNNEELDKLIKHENIVNYIKAQRLSWLGHIQRMPEARATKKVFKWNPLATRPRGRPKYRWEDNIIQDLGQLKIKNWLTCVQDRAKWKDVVEKAKTSN